MKKLLEEYIIFKKIASFNQVHLIHHVYSPSMQDEYIALM